MVNEKRLLWMQGEVTNLADYQIAHGVTVQEWIPVEERTPTEADGTEFCKKQMSPKGE